MPSARRAARRGAGRLRLRLRPYGVASTGPKIPDCDIFEFAYPDMFFKVFVEPRWYSIEHKNTLVTWVACKEILKILGYYAKEAMYWDF